MKAPDTRRGYIREAGAIYVLGFVLVLALALLALASGLVARNLYVLVAAVFVGLPYLVLTRRGLDFEAFGLTTRRWPSDVLWGLVATAVTLPLFFAGYHGVETRVRAREYTFSVDNLRKWPAELEGRPAGVGDGPGVWVWTRGGNLHVALSADPASPTFVTVEADRPFHWASFGTARAHPLHDARGRRIAHPAEMPTRATAGPAAAWALATTGTDRPAELVLSPRTNPDGYPSRITIGTASRPGAAGASQALPIYLGPAASPAGDVTDRTFERGFLWIALWSMTHLLFIALPEEYFYRGYLQTRLAQAFGDAPDRPRTWLGVSRANLVTSALFALGHLLIPVGGALYLSRAAVFFPSLAFGWLRERTGSIVAPVVYHACCNMMVLVVAVHFH